MQVGIRELRGLLRANVKTCKKDVAERLKDYINPSFSDSQCRSQLGISTVIIDKHRLGQVSLFLQGLLGVWASRLRGGMGAPAPKCSFQNVCFKMLVSKCLCVVERSRLV